RRDRVPHGTPGGAHGPLVGNHLDDAPGAGHHRTAPRRARRIAPGKTAGGAAPLQDHPHHAAARDDSHPVLDHRLRHLHVIWEYGSSLPLWWWVSFRVADNPGVGQTTQYKR